MMGAYNTSLNEQLKKASREAKERGVDYLREKLQEDGSRGAYSSEKVVA